MNPSGEKAGNEMNENDNLGVILRELALLAMENSDVRQGRLSDEDYRKHCVIVMESIESRFPPEQ